MILAGAEAKRLMMMIRRQVSFHEKLTVSRKKIMEILHMKIMNISATRESTLNSRKNCNKNAAKSCCKKRSTVFVT